MRFRFTAISELVLEHFEGDAKSTHVATNLRLELSKNLDRKLYLKNDLPTKEGVKPLTQALVQGLIANIHHAHEKKFWDSAEHLRYIISELERGFVEVAEVKESTMKDYTNNSEG